MPMAVIMLNTEQPDCAATVWGAEHGGTGLRVCTDGAVDRLPELCRPIVGQDYDTWHSNFSRHPDVIIGDLDSISERAKNAYQRSPGKLLQIHDQNSTDFTKALRHLQHVAERDVNLKSGTKRTVVVLGGLGGRLDQTLATLHALLDPTLTRLDINIIDNDNRVKIFFAGKHTLPSTTKSEAFTLGPHCGLFPFASRPVVTKTKGLQWCMDGTQPMSLAPGGLTSTNNRRLPGVPVEIECDGPILYIEECKYTGPNGFNADGSQCINSDSSKKHDWLK